jgi:hypothetical protein
MPDVAHHAAGEGGCARAASLSAHRAAGAGLCKARSAGPPQGRGAPRRGATCAASRAAPLRCRAPSALPRAARSTAALAPENGSNVSQDQNGSSVWQNQCATRRLADASRTLGGAQRPPHSPPLSRRPHESVERRWGRGEGCSTVSVASAIHSAGSSLGTARHSNPPSGPGRRTRAAPPCPSPASTPRTSSASSAAPAAIRSVASSPAQSSCLNRARPICAGRARRQRRGTRAVVAEARGARGGSAR